MGKEGPQGAGVAALGVSQMMGRGLQRGLGGLLHVSYF